MFKQLFLNTLSILGGLSLYGQSNISQVSSKTSVTFLDEVVLTDSRFGLKRSQSGRFVQTIESEAIQDAQGLTIGQLLSSYAGINIIGHLSYPGQNLTTSIRGGRDKNVLILIDGVRMADPAQISNQFNLNFVDLSQVERIEIIKGAASALYGSSAAAGVINIITKKASQKSQLSIRATTGSVRPSGESIQPFSSREVGLSTAGALGNNNWTYQLAVAHAYADGMSAVDGDEVDPFERTNINFRLEASPSVNFKWKLSLDKNIVVSDYDDSFPSFSDAPNQQRTNSNRVSLNPVWKNKRGTFGAQLSYQDTYRRFLSSFDYETQGQYSIADVYQKWSLSQKTSLLTGIQYQRSQDPSIENSSLEQSDYYVQGGYTPENGLQLHAAARYNTNKNYGDHWSVRLNPSLRYTFIGAIWQLGFSYNTAFIAPSLFQVYSPEYGNTELTPETTINREINLQWSHLRDFMNVSLFNRKEKNPVVFYYDTVTSSSYYLNGEGVQSYSGIEVEGQYQLSQKFRFNYQYAYIETDGGNLVRLPKHAGLLALKYQPSSQLSMCIQYQHQGSRKDISGDRMSPFDLVHLHLSKQSSIQGLRLNLNVQNLFDEQYVESRGYLTRGRQLLFGLNYTLP